MTLDDGLFLIEEWFPELKWSLKMRSTREKTEK